MVKFDDRNIRPINKRGIKRTFIGRMKGGKLDKIRASRIGIHRAKRFRNLFILHNGKRLTPTEFLKKYPRHGIHSGKK